MHKFRHLSSWKHLEVKLIRGSRIGALTTEGLDLVGRILQDLRATSSIGSPNVADDRHKGGACSSQRCVSQWVRECVRHLLARHLQAASSSSVNKASRRNLQSFSKRLAYTPKWLIYGLLTTRYTGNILGTVCWVNEWAVNGTPWNPGSMYGFPLERIA